MGFVQLTDEETTSPEVRGTMLGVPIGTARSFKHQVQVFAGPQCHCSSRLPNYNLCRGYAA